MSDAGRSAVRSFAPIAPITSIALLALIAVAACGGPAAPPPARSTARAVLTASPAASPPQSPAPPAPTAAPTAALPAPTAAPTAAPSASPSEQPSPPASGETRAEAAERVLFLATHLRTTDLRRVCPVTLDEDPRVRCLVAHRYEDDPDTKKLALTLYAETGSLAGLLPEETTEDGRGQKVRLLPARPVGANRDHLTWIIAAMRDYQRFIDGLSARGPVAFKHKPLDFRFFYSEKGGMPSAFAARRNIGYNLRGAVNVNEDAVRSTLFHEIFHLNDGWKGEWSRAALTPIYDKIIARCARRNACLSAYAPTDTMLDGTFYAFARQGTVREYAAETALRYYYEHRLVLQGKPLPLRPFKCGPEESREAWRLLVAEFFGGIDLVECPAAT